MLEEFINMVCDWCDFSDYCECMIEATIVSHAIDEEIDIHIRAINELMFGSIVPKKEDLSLVATKCDWCDWSVVCECMVEAAVLVHSFEDDMYDQYDVAAKAMVKKGIRERDQRSKDRGILLEKARDALRLRN
jgi:hypothetical protein